MRNRYALLAKYYGKSTFWNDTLVPYTNPLPYTYTTYAVWNTASTSTGENGIKNMMVAMGYSYPTFANYTSECTKSLLDLNKPIYMIGCRADYKGHAWVVDGYKRYMDVTTSHFTSPPTITTTYRYYNHINWGWYGKSNGYFLDGVFATNNAFQYDYIGYGVESHSFTNSLKYFAPEP